LYSSKIPHTREIPQSKQIINVLGSPVPVFGEDTTGHEHNQVILKRELLKNHINQKVSSRALN